MKAPRISIAGMVLAVAIVALDCAVFRALFLSDGWDDLVPLLVIGAIPVVNALIIGAFCLIRRRPPARRASPFLWGFEATGILALAAFAIVILCRNGPILRAAEFLFKSIFAWLKRSINLPDTGTPLSDILEIGFEIVPIFVIFSTPQILAALIGGAITRMCWLARAGRREGGPSDQAA